MDFVCEFYNSLLWITERDEEGNESKKPYMSINEIDEMDFFFFLDLKIYELKKANKEIAKDYDNRGL